MLPAALPLPGPTLILFLLQILQNPKQLKNIQDIEVIIFDSNNYHLFQPLLYQVAMAGLDPADIAYPLRTVFSGIKNIKIYLGAITEIKKMKTWL